MGCRFQFKYLLLQTKIAALLLAVTASVPLKMLPPIPEEKPKDEIIKVVKWSGPDFTEREKKALHFFQDRGIKDRAALSVILGNIKQESKFHPNICEGGAKVGYYNCKWGGFGLIQWTWPSRYLGLGVFARKNQLNPSTMEAQLQYMVQEKQWKEIERSMKYGGHSIDYYMDVTYSWIGWGIPGSRTKYAYDYYNRLERREFIVS